MFEDDYRLYELRNPNFWGPIYWDMLYLTVLGFPITLQAEQKKHFRDLLQNFHFFLPCDTCRTHFRKEVESLKDFTSRDDALKEIIRLHNSVRIRLNKEPLRETQVLSYFYGLYTRPRKIMVLIALVLILLLLIWCNKG